MREILHARLQSQLRSGAADEIVVRRSIVVAQKACERARPGRRWLDGDIQRPAAQLRDVGLRAVRPLQRVRDAVDGFGPRNRARRQPYGRVVRGRAVEPQDRRAVLQLDCHASIANFRGDGLIDADVPESSRGHLPRLNHEVVLRGLHEDVLTDRLEVVAQAIERQQVRIARTVAAGPVRVGRVVAAAASAATVSPAWNSLGGGGSSGFLQKSSSDRPATTICADSPPLSSPTEIGRVAFFVINAAPALPSGHLQPPGFTHSASFPDVSSGRSMPKPSSWTRPHPLKRCNTMMSALPLISRISTR